MNQYLAWLTMPTIGRTIQFKVNIGANVFDAFNEVIEKNNVSFGVVVSCCGALKSAVFRNVKEAQHSFPIEQSNLQSFKCENPMEITSLNGWFYNNHENKMIHLHCSASCNKADIPIVYGGHLVDAVAGPKMVITIQELIADNLLIGYDDQCKKTDLICYG